MLFTKQWRSVWWLLLGALLLGCGGEAAVEEVEPPAATAVQESTTAAAEAAAPTEAPTSAPTEEPQPTAEPEPTEAPTAAVVAELQLSDMTINDSLGLMSDDALAVGECTQRLINEGQLVLYVDNTLDFMPADPEAVGDCFELAEELALTGSYRAGDENVILYYEFDEWLPVLTSAEEQDAIISGHIARRTAEGEFIGRVNFFISQTGDDGIGELLYTGDEEFLLSQAADLGLDTALVEPLEVTYSVNDFLAAYGPIPFLPAPESMTSIEINSVHVAYLTAEPPEAALAQVKGYMAGLDWEFVYEDVDSAGREMVIYERGSESASVRFETGIGTIVSVSISNSEPWSELPIVPLLPDAQIGELYYQQNYEAEGTMAELGEFYLAATNDQLAAAGWSLVEDNTAVGSRGIRWMRDGQEVFISASDASVNIFYLFDELATVNLEDYNAAALAAQGEQEAIQAQSSLPAINPADYSGEVVIAGSSYGVIADDIVRKFTDDGFPGEAYVYLGNGTANEILLLCIAGEVDGVTAGRALTEEEVATCTANGAQMVEFVVGRTPTAVLLNPANSWATEMTAAELALAFTTAATWADVNPAWPDTPIERFLPAENSFMIARLVNRVLGEDREALLGAANTLFSEDDNAILDGVAGSEGAIGLVDYRFALENSDQPTAVVIDGLAPGAREYLLDAPITVYTLDTIMQQQPEVAAYMNYLLVYGGELADEYEFLPVDQTTREANEARWLEIASQ